MTLSIFLPICPEAPIVRTFVRIHFFRIAEHRSRSLRRVCEDGLFWYPGKGELEREGIDWEMQNTTMSIFMSCCLGAEHTMGGNKQNRHTLLYCP